MLLCYRFFLLFAAILIAVPAFSLEWHKAYERGRERIKNGDCSQGQALMQEALRGNPKADPRTPSYGTQIIEYFPQYYLAVCALEAGRLQDAQRYLKESEGSRISSSKLASEFQSLKSKLNGLLQQQQATKPVETKPPQQQQKVEPKPQPPPEKKAEPAVRDNRAAVDAAIQNARDALRNGRYDEARKAVNAAIRLQPDNGEARSLLSEIASRQVDETQAREKQEKVRNIEQAIKRGDLGSAENMALTLKVQYPSDSRVTDLLQQIENRKNAMLQDLKAQDVKKTAEREVLTAYYRGDYDQAIQLARENLSRAPQSWRLHFFLGCSYAALSMLEEDNTEARLTLARESFRRARTISRSVSLPPHISPKILEIYRTS